MLQDPFGRTVNYLRLSVTDRCDFRCVYCMAEEMTFVPRQQLLTLEEMTDITTAFQRLGVKKVRITGGEPLIRRNILQLFHNLGTLPLDELTLTTNGSQLANCAHELVQAGVKRINISLDSLQPERFRELTRTGELSVVLKGIDAALEAGLKVKLNSVILKHRNLDEAADLVQYAVDREMDISFIEEMPLGVIAEHQRQEEFVSSASLREHLGAYYDLLPIENNAITAGGPSRYWRIANRANNNSPNSKSRVGFISPHSDNFCESCNRVRLTATGQLLLCLGNEHSVDLKAVVRRYPKQPEPLQEAIINAMTIKPERHDFDLASEPQILRFMNATGG